MYLLSKLYPIEITTKINGFQKWQTKVYALFPHSLSHAF